MAKIPKQLAKQAKHTQAEAALMAANRTTLESAFEHWWNIFAPLGTPDPEREIELVPGRRFRCDFVWKESRVIVEVDGGQWAYKGGRHNTDEDRHKINLLTLQGWRVLRYSGTMLEADPQAVIWEVASAVLNLKPSMKGLSLSDGNE
jgi:hypothetical protein